MTPKRWKEINEVYQSVVDLESMEQRAYLDKACSSDKSLRDQVETLLAANNEAGIFIEDNAAKDVGHLIGADNHSSLIGKSLGRYEIISELGAGGMGTVYLAMDEKLARSIAIKTLPSLYASEADYVKRFQTEAKAAATLNHPNVATVYSVEETDEANIFITMEFVEGKPLSDFIPVGGVNLRTFFEWFLPLSDALVHAHEKGIVHRDIKPHNIMILPGGEPKILDFGLARINTKDTVDEISTFDLTKTGQILGTPAYMSPEQAEGKRIDHRTDIFSFGIVMYEAITGTKPFKGNSYAAIISDLLTKDPVNISSINPDVPELISRLIMKCLNKEPRYRYQSMSEVRVLLQEINSAVTSGVSLSIPHSRSSLTPRILSKASIFGTIGLLALLAMVVIWSGYFGSGNSDKAVTRFAVSFPNAAKLNVLSAELSPDGQELLMTTFRDEGESIVVRSLDDYEVKPIAGSEAGRRPFFSPDGKWIAFSTNADAVKKVPFEGGSPVIVCENCPSKRRSFWGKDNYLYLSNDKGLFRVLSDGGTAEQLTTIDIEGKENSHFHPQLLPDNNSILFTVSSPTDPKIAILSLADKKWTYIEETGKAWFGQYLSSGHIVFARGNQLMAAPFSLQTLKTTGKPTLLLHDLFERSPNFQIATNGTLVYLATIPRTDNEVVWVDRTGKSNPAIDKKGDFSSPRISPDGSRIVVRLDNDIWVYDINTGGGIRITDSDKNEVPMWTLDGRSVIYSTEKDGVYTVNKKNAAGTGVAEQLSSGSNRMLPYSLHPSEGILALAESSGQGELDIVAIYPNEKITKPVVVTKFREDTPRFSPDGKWLAYYSMDSGRPQVYVHPWDDPGKKIAVTKNGGMFPVFSPSGRELFYRLASTFYSAKINTSQGFEILEKTRLFEGRYLTSFDVSRDGEKLLMVKDEHGTLPIDMNVILNWDEELLQILDSPK